MSSQRLTKYWNKYLEHTRVKHDLLKYYLELWSNILGSVKKELVFWDCFAGQGSYSGGQLGSPLIAMEKSLECRKKGIKLTCVFIESGKASCTRLRETLRTLYPDDEGILWYVFCGNYTEVYRSEGNGKLSAVREFPALYFLDPIGFKDLPIELLREMMLGSKKELLITLMVEDIKRHRGTAGVQSHFKYMFGLDDLTSLDNICLSGSSEDIVDFYEEQLKRKLGSPVFTKHFQVTPLARQVVKYYLVFVTRSKKGLEAMHDSMRAISQNDDLSFKGKKDRTETGQNLEVYFESNIEHAARWILNLGLRITNMNHICYLSHLETDRAFSKSELRQGVLLLEKQGRLVIEGSPGRARRKGTVGRHWLKFVDDES